MKHPLPRRHRFPKKRNIPRVLLLIALPAVLVLLLIASAAVLTDEPAGDPLLPHEAQAVESITMLEEKDAYPQGPLPEGLQFTKLLLEKGRHRLTAYNGVKPMRVYLVALGESPVGHKQFEGDKRTPEGSYTIDGKNPKSAYYKNLGISYPNAADRARAAARKKSPGGDIKIHGLAPDFADIGQAHRLTDWTFGCIAVTNEEMEELYQRTPVGIPIEIVP